MSAGASKNYRDNPRKNHWRRWVWNRIAERLEKPAAEAVVVGLFGKETADLPIALCKGFRRENIFNVERDKNAADSTIFRTIRGELADVLFAWKPNPPIDVVLADCCGGMTEDSGWGLIPGLTRGGSLAQYPVIAINLLRGRENNFSSWEHLRGHRASDEWIERFGSPLHRGRYFLLGYATEILAIVVRAAQDRGEILDRLPPELQGLIGRACVSTAVFESYCSSSGSQTFDSVVFNPVHGFVAGQALEEDLKPLRASIAALKAHAFGNRK